MFTVAGAITSHHAHAPLLKQTFGSMTKLHSTNILPVIFITEDESITVPWEMNT